MSLAPRSRVLAAAALAALLAPSPARAWSANGHRTVALIAESRLSPAVQQAIAAILGPNAALDAIAPCADDIRGRRGFDCAGLQLNAEPQSEPWHFVDVPISESPGDPSALESFCPGGNCVIDQIRADLKVLRDPSAAPADKQVALMFLVHFVGDEHQPLHCADEMAGGVNDRGGNLKNVTFAGTALNLHSLWDHQIQPADTNDPVATSQRLIADLKTKDASGWTGGDFVGSAAFESFEVAKSTVYPSYYAADPNSLGPDYAARMRPIVDERLERAGVRLAAILEQALAPAGVAPPAPAPPAPTAGLEKAKTKARAAAAGSW